MPITTGKFSVAFWIKPVDVNTMESIISKWSNGACFYITTYSSGKIRFSIYLNGTTTTLYSPANLLANDTWSHVVCTYDGHSHRIYVDGELQITGSDQNCLAQNSNGNLQMGYLQYQNQFTGTLDDVHLYEGALPEDEIEGLIDANCPYAHNPNPLDNAEYIDSNSILSWLSGYYTKDVNGHDIYFGTSFTDVNNANTISDEYQGNQTSNSLKVSNLDPNTTYYWRIDENESDSTVNKGTIWSFTVKP